MSTCACSGLSNERAASDYGYDYELTQVESESESKSESECLSMVMSVIWG